MSLRKGGQIIAGAEETKFVSGHTVGEIFWTSRLTPQISGAVDADGKTYPVTAFTGKESVPALLAKGELPSISMAEYESIVSKNGFCRVWGWDGGDKFRVPTVKALSLTKEQAAVVGNGMTVGWTNGTNNFGVGGFYGSGGSQSTGNYGLPVGSSSVSANVSTLKTVGLTTDPEKSSIVSNLDVDEYRAMVQLATTVQEDAPQLKEYKFNNPHFFGQSMWTDVDPNNASWLVSNGSFHSGRTYVDYYNWLTDIKSGNKTVDGVSVKSVDDEYTDYEWVVNTADNTFRLPIKVRTVGGGTTPVSPDGYLKLGSETYEGTVRASAVVGGVRQNTVGIQGDSTTATDGVFFEDRSGLSVDLSNSTNSNLKLYFYVGDTVQDASLINAAELLDYFSKLYTVHCVVDTFKSGSSWYRVYDDGWVEQGGTLSLSACPQTITLLKQYRDNNYTICIGGGDPDSNASVCATSVYSRAVGSFSLVNGFNGTFYSCVISWMACGYGA